MKIIFIYLFLFLNYQIVYAFDLNTCKDDPNCNFCFETEVRKQTQWVEVSGESSSGMLEDGSFYMEKEVEVITPKNFYQCVEKHPYSSTLKGVNYGVKTPFCTNPTKKTVCNYDKNNKTYVCPLGNNLDCFETDTNVYECSPLTCYHGTEMKIKNEAPEDNGFSENNSENNNTKNNEGNTCNLNTIKIFSGQKMTCKEQDKTTIGGIGNNCCNDIGTGTYNTNESNREAITEGLYKSIAGGDMSGVATNLGITNLINGPVAIFYSGMFDLLVQWGVFADNPISILAGKIVDMWTGGSCTQEEITLSTLRNSYKTGDGDGTCIYLGSYCSDYRGTCVKMSIFGKDIEYVTVGGCKRHARAYCCYPSIMDKAIIKAARDQLGKSFGVYPTSPNENPCNKQNTNGIDCSGILVEEISKLNLNTPSFNADLEDFVKSKMNEIDINSYTENYESSLNKESLVNDILDSYKN